MFRLKNFLAASLALVLVALLSAACHTHKNHDKADQGKKTNEMKQEKKEDMATEETSTDRPEILKLGQVIRVTKDNPINIKSEWMEIRLREVTDSRCPKGVNCIQAGKAEVRLMMIRQGDMASDIRLTAKGNCFDTDGSCGNSKTTQGYKFTLVSLTPYPGDDGKTAVAQDKYVASIVVEKANNGGSMKK